MCSESTRKHSGGELEEEPLAKTEKAKQKSLKSRAPSLQTRRKDPTKRNAAKENKLL